MNGDQLAQRFTPLAKAITGRILRATPLATADDVYSDALMGLAKAIDQLDETRPMGMQVRFIEQKIWNECLHGRRSRARARRRNGWPDDIPDIPVSGVFGFVDAAVALKRLPVSEQPVVVLAGLGFSQDEIACRLGVSQMTVSRRLRQARKQLEREDK